MAAHWLDAPAVKNSSGASAEGKNWKLMLADTRFYLMIIAFTIFATGGLMVVSQGSPMAQAIGRGGRGSGGNRGQYHWSGQYGRQGALGMGFR